MAEIAVFGTVAADVVFRVPVLPLPGDHVSGEPLGWRLGGSSANVACALATAGHGVELIGPVGDDDVAEALIAELERRGVRMHRAIRVPAPSPKALILLDASGERTMVVLDRGSAADAFPIDDPPDVGAVDCVYVESYERFSTVVADRSPDALLVVTPPAAGERSWPADIVVGSERQYPTAWLDSPFESARATAGPRLRWLIVTRGRRGADAYGAQGSFHVPGRPAKQVDATGAGDAFAGHLISSLLAGHGIQDALEFGAAQGAAAVEVLQSVPPEWIASVEPA